MLLGYNTNGFANHRVDDALETIAGLGYAAVGLTLDPHAFHPPDHRGVNAYVDRVRPILAKTGLIPVVETGAGFILDPRRKHQPTLLSEDPNDRRRRIDYLTAAVDIATGLGANTVSLWSGAAETNGLQPAAMERLCTSMTQILDHAATRNIRIAFEPEPGMAVETMSACKRLVDQLNHPALGLTLDVGHVHCLGDGNITDHIRQWRHCLWNVHIEDMRRGTHEHLMFGQGDVDVPPIIETLRDIDYDGPLIVELSRHSHNAVEAAGKAFQFLAPLIQNKSHA